MSRTRWLIYSAVFWLAGLTAAQADPTVWTDEFDPDDIFLSASSPATNLLSFTLDIRQGSDGFRPGIDTIDNAALTLVLFDDFDFGKELVSFNYDGTGWTPPESVSPFSLFFFDPTSLLSDGLLTVSLTSTRGDFFFDNAFLAAFGERVAVPEPATVGLLGAGLFGMGWFVRRRAIAAKR